MDIGTTSLIPLDFILMIILNVRDYMSIVRMTCSQNCGLQLYVVTILPADATDELIELIKKESGCIPRNVSWLFQILGKERYILIKHSI